MHPPRLRLSATWGVILSCKFEEEAFGPAHCIRDRRCLVVWGGMVYDSSGIEVIVMLKEEVPMVDHR